MNQFLSRLARPCDFTAGAIPILQFSLDIWDHEAPEFHSLLSAEECHRADAFRFEIHRTRYIAGRAILRIILAQYLDQSPRELKIVTGPGGKPRLADDRSGIRFNISHSEELCLCALSRNRELGIDVEKVWMDLEALTLARQFLSLEETEALEHLPVPERERLFFRYWTQKEAEAKAKGGGLGCSLPERSCSWQSIDIGNDCLSLGSGYAAYLVIEGLEPALPECVWRAS